MFSSSAFDTLNQPLINRSLSRPSNSQEAQARLEVGNTAFRRWVADAYTPRYIEEEPGTHERRALLGSVIPVNQIPTQTPFAAVVGCSDARVPVRLLFGQSVNDIFEIRTAGQALGNECVGSLEDALAHLKSIKTIVVIGHSGCGPVTAAVDAYLRDGRKPILDSSGLQSIINRILPSVILADETLKRSTLSKPGHADHRRHLIEMTTTLNAAAGASRLRHFVESYGREDVSVLHGVYDIASQAVMRPLHSELTPEDRLGLATAPAEESDLEAIADQIVEAMSSASSLI
ncbi:hypothetical protein C5Y96_15075 [Blastopirellula marina]|uniref:carbonic anhydrase n=1 Tax=Blastopirellula marina TaxID=124 RepID=A0A2S8FCY7_9BACT|nr:MULTISPECIES: carbonic anhydrase [Pirellulaceae]PQO30033.1 hypothetical protein C5Y96_15075 [Blastopirellula marina]RCS50468.1 hypothetical protein DTL36_15085 [Bremerella cremea]